MVVIDWKGIERTHRAMGGEGTILIMLRTAQEWDADQLDAASSPHLEHSPANGGWFPALAGPRGWLLLVEGLAPEVEPWLEGLAARLERAGVEGQLTGAPRATTPRWAQRAYKTPSLSASIGFRVVPGNDPFNGWGGVEGTRAVAAQASMAWLTARGGRIMVHGDMDSQYWVDPNQATKLLETVEIGYAPQRAESFEQEHREIRSTTLRNNARWELVTNLENQSWDGMVDDLRSALLGLPLELVSVAMVSHRGWGDSLMASLPGSDYYHFHAYRWHPELSGEYLIDAAGIQIVTDQHLAKAADLSGWNLTRLDDTHHLLEAPNLEPWFDEPSRVGEEALPEVAHQARSDFGDMILTRERAEELGITAKPPRPGTP